MTRDEIYTIARDRDIIVNREWQNPNMYYIRLGKLFYRKDLVPIKMLFEKDTDMWTIKGQISVSEKKDMTKQIINKLQTNLD